MAPGGMRILSWKSPKEGPVSSASDILAFQPMAMAASRRQREERTEVRRAAYRAKVSRREASRGMPKRPNIGRNPLTQKAGERAVALRQGEALARSISQGRPSTAAPRQRSWEAAQPEEQPGQQEQVEAIKDRNEKIKQELLLAAQQWERKPRALGPQPQAFSKPRPRLWQRPSSAPIPPPADLDHGGIRHDFGSDVDPEDLPDLDAAENEELDTSTKSNGVEDRGPITSQLVRQPSMEMFLQTAKVEADAQKALANLQLELESPAKARQQQEAADKSMARERPRSASYHEGSSGSENERTRRSPSTLEYLKTVSNEDNSYGMRGVESVDWASTLEELSDTALATDATFPFHGELSMINAVDASEVAGRGAVTPNASTADDLGQMASGTSLGIEDLQVGSGGLATLRIREYGMRDAMCINVAASIKSDRSTGKAPLLVDLAHNLIRDEGVLALADAIETNSRCAALDLSYNFVKSNGAVALARCLPYSKLRRLDLSHNPLGSTGIKSIGNAIGLPGTAGLRSLKISHVGMGAVGTVALAEGVAANKGLRVLDISGNQLRKSGAMALAANLEINVTQGNGAGLTALNLSWCGIDDSPVQLFSQGLKSGCSLRRLDLSNNQVSTDGAQSLAMMMKDHKGMQLLILDNNPAIAFEGCKKFVSLQLDSIIDEVVFESKEDDDDEGKVKMAGTEGKRIVHVTQCSAEQLPSKMLGASNQWERHLYKVGICGLSMSGFGLPAAEARSSSAKAALEAAKLAQAAASAGENVVTQADAEDAVEKAAAALAKEEEEAKLAEEAASKERQEAEEAKRRSQQEWADVVQAERWLAKAEAALDAALMLPDGDAEVQAAEKELEKARATLEKEKAEAKAAEEAFRREREEADLAEARAAKEREEAEEARQNLKTKEARARTGAGATVKKEVKKPAVPKQVRRRPRTAKFVMKRAVGKQIVQQRLRVETMADTVKSLGIPLKGGGTSRQNPPICGAASADPLDRRRTTGFGSKIHALHYTDTSLRTDYHLSQSSAMLQRPKGQSMMTSYNKGFTKSQSRMSLIRPQSAAGKYTAGTSALSSTDTSPLASNPGDPSIDRAASESDRDTSGWATGLTGGSRTAFGSSHSSVRSGASTRRPHTAGVARPIRSVDSYIPIGSYTAVA